MPILPVRLFSRRYRQLRRYRHIVEVFLRQGFGYLIEQLDLHHFIPLRRRVLPVDEMTRANTRGVRLRQALQDLGPTFVKLGQLVSTRADIVPRDIVEDLQYLQDHVPGVPFSEIKKRIEFELGKPLAEAYREFDPEPLAAASIGQVHRAVLPTGEEVAVKVQRPGIEQVIGVDLEILYGLAGLVEERFHPDFIRPRELVDQFARTLRSEMNYETEARYMEGFRQRFADNPNVRVPRVYWEWTTERLLTMDYIRGVKISDIAALDALGVDRVELARRGARFFLKQVLIDGIFHGDPHPGNLFVETDGTLAVVDFGMVGRIDDQLMTYVADLFVGIIGRDVERVVQGMIRIGVVEGAVDRRALKADMEELIDRHYGKPLHKLQMGQIIGESFELTRRHRIRMPSDFVLLGKALLTMESTGKALDPQFNAIEIAEPFARDLLARRWSPESISRRLTREILDYGDVLVGIPRKLDRVLWAAQEGQLEIRFRHQGLEKMIHRMDVASNRLAAGLVIASLVIGSSLIIQSDRGPFLWGFPLVGLAGFGFAACIGIWLVISILRSGRI